MKKLLLSCLIILFYFSGIIFNHCVLAKTTKPITELPKISFLYPKDDLTTTKNLVLFKGTVENTTTLNINQVNIPITPAGKFYYRFKLEHPNTYHLFNVLAFSQDHQLQVQKKVFYKVPVKLLPKPEPEPKVKEQTRQKADTVPKIEVSSPENNQVFEKETIVIRGIVSNTDEFYINERKVKPDNKGYFYETFKIKAVGAFTFNLLAFGKENIPYSKIIKIIRVNRYQPKELSAFEKKNKRLQKKLNTKISLELSNADIKAVMKILSEKGNLNIVSDKKLTGEVDLSLKNVTLKSAIDVILKSQGISYKIIDNTLIIADQRNLNRPTLLKTDIIKLNNLDGKAAIKVVSNYISNAETIEYIEQENLLVINADETKIEKIRHIIKEIDQEKIPQIILEAKIIETSTTALSALGISWPRSLATGVDINRSNDTTSVQSSFTVAAILNILQEKGLAKVLANPRIKALHEKQATIFIGDQVPYTQTTVDNTGRLSESVNFQELGIYLSIFPEINLREQEITILIEPEVSYIFGFRGANNDIPWIKTRKVKTTVSVRDGETVIIGGLFNSSDSNNVSKIPLLGDIPLLGGFFQNQKDDRSQSELVITITPKIVN